VRRVGIAVPIPPNWAIPVSATVEAYFNPEKPEEAVLARESRFNIREVSASLCEYA
jgi:hypothetical protein